MEQNRGFMGYSWMDGIAKEYAGPLLQHPTLSKERPISKCAREENGAGMRLAIRFARSLTFFGWMALVGRWMLEHADPLNA